MTVQAVRHPLLAAREPVLVPAGSTVAQIVAAVQPRPELWRYAHVLVGDRPVPAAWWGRVRPKPGVPVTVRLVPGGPGTDDPNGLLRAVALVAVAVAAPYAAGALGATGLGAALVTTGAVLAGTWAVYQLLPVPPPPKPEGVEAPGATLTNPGIAGAANRVNKYGVIPRVLGRHRIAPPYAARPYTHISANKQYLHVLLNFGYGPLRISDLKIGETAIEDLDGVTVWPRDLDSVGGSGYDYDAKLGGFSRTVDESALSVELTEAGGFQTQTTGLDTDEISVDVTFPSGLYQLNTDGSKAERTVALEVQFGPVGASPAVWSAGVSAGAGGISRSADSVTLVQPTAWPALGEGPSGPLPAVQTRRIARVVLVGESGQVDVLYGYTRPQAGTTGYAIVAPTAPAVPPGYLKLAQVVLYSDDSTISAGDITDERATIAAYDKAGGDFVVSAGGGLAVDIAAGTLLSLGISVTDARAEPIRRTIVDPADGTSAITFRMPPAGDALHDASGQYNVRIRRLTADSEDSSVVDTVQWTALRAITYERPVNRAGLALVAMQIKASDQASGRLNEINAVCESILPDWDGDSSSWVTRPTRNPAALFRHVLQGAPGANVVADSRIDLTALQAWSEANQGDDLRLCDLVVAEQLSVWAVLTRIAAVGRAAPALQDNQWTVVRDTEQSTPIQHFTPRNSGGFEAHKAFRATPHALRCRFLNEDQGWREDELLVYDDGYTAANATDIEAMELPGVTDADRVWALARYHIATARLRPETYSFYADIEHLVCQRGDLIRFTHDVTLHGLKGARVMAVTDDGGSPAQATAVRLDETVTLEAGTSYALRFRLSDGSTLLKDVDTPSPAGETNTLTFSTPYDLGDGPAVGDLALFGESGSESVELIVRGIEPGPELAARLVCVDAAPAVHKAGQAPQTFTSSAVSAANDTITQVGHNYQNGDVLQFSNDASPVDLPAPLAVATDYTVQNRTADTYQLTADPDASPVVLVDFTDGGSGTHTATRQIPAFSSQITAEAGPGRALAKTLLPTVDEARSDGEVLVRAPDGSFVSRILLTLTIPSGLREDIDRIEGQYRRTGSGEDWRLEPAQPLGEGQFSFFTVEDGRTYDYRVRYVTEAGLRGAWTTTASHTVEGVSAPPTDISGFKAEQNGLSVTLFWDKIPDLDLAGVRLRYGVVGTAWADGTPLHDTLQAGRVTDAAIPPSPENSDGTRAPWQLMAKAVDTSGNESDTAAIVQVTITPPYDAIVRERQAPVWPGDRVNLVRNPRTGHLALEDQANADAATDFSVFDSYVQTAPTSVSYTAPEIDISYDDECRVWGDTAARLAPGGSGLVNPQNNLDYRLEAGSYDGFEVWGIGTVTARRFIFKLSHAPGDNELVLEDFTPTVDLLEHSETANFTVSTAADGVAVAFGRDYREVPAVEITPPSGKFASFHGVTEEGFRVWLLDSNGDTTTGTGSYTATGL